DPRYMTPGGIFDAVNADITTWCRADLKDVDDANIGLAGSPTKIAKASDKVRKGAGEKVVPDTPEDAVKYIVGKLDEKHVI
ncbi:MAG: electron transfer flavoprotein subunit beta, partial [Lachnospiraceae bacterium]|nr:electron transfer flavoprotein subunit beta [Lachnospiraceae bacterium]